MRYLLIVVGLLAVLVGWTSRSASLFVEVGAVFLAVGLATVDIVQAIKAKRQ
jgi:hypothetical protein